MSEDGRDDGGEKKPRPVWRTGDWLCVLLLVLVVLVLYAPGVRFGFLPFWDDDVNVHGNPLLFPVTASSWLRIWTEPYQQLFIPVTYSAWALLATVSRWWQGVPPNGALDPRVFHAANLVLHAAAAVVAFRIIKRLLEPARGVVSRWPALLGALFFAVHPAQVEAVVWVSGFRDVLSGLLALASIDLFLAWAHDGDRKPFGSRRWWLATLCFALALGSKPAAVSTVLLAAVLAFPMRWRRLVVALIPWLFLGFLWALLTRFWAQTDPGIETGSVPLWAHPFVAADAAAFYLLKAAWPWPLILDYGRAPAIALSRGWVFWTWLLPAGLLGLLVGVRRLRPYVRFLVAFVATLLPVLGLVSFNFQSVSTVADRYLYVALIAPAAVLAIVRSRSPRWTVVPLAGLLLVLALMTQRHVHVWRSGETLFAATIHHNPASWKAHHNYASALDDRGAYKESLAHYREAARLVSNRAEIFNDMGVTLANLNRFDEAATAFEKALTLRPKESTAMNLSVVRRQAGDAAGELDACRQAVAVAPNSAEALHRLSWVLSTSPDDSLRDGVHALRLARRLVRVSSTNDGAPYVTLAAALAENGAFEEAVAAARQAETVFSRSGQNDAAAFARETLVPALQEKKPIRDHQGSGAE